MASSQILPFYSHELMNPHELNQPMQVSRPMHGLIRYQAVQVTVRSYLEVWFRSFIAHAVALPAFGPVAIVLEWGERQSCSLSS